MVNLPSIAARRQQERDALLARLRADLEADAQVAAVWLYGSLGRGTGDAWSDLDLWLVVFDGSYSGDIRHTFTGGALFIEEAPQNAPPGGSYIMTAHDAPTGPHLVDWYFQPLRLAIAGDGRRLLFSRAPLPETPEAIPAATAPYWEPSEDEADANTAALFWAMLLIQAKYIARKPVEEGMGFEGFLLSLLRQVAGRKGVALDESETPGLQNAPDKINRLRDLGDRMAEVGPEFAAPHIAANRFLDTVREATNSATSE